MSEHRIDISWSRDECPFERGNYVSDHTVRFSGAQSLANSAAVEADGTHRGSNPEELLLAAISSCHMLTFLAVAANRGWVVDSYEDQAVATLDKDADGKTAVTHAVLSPKVRFGGEKQPSTEDYETMQHRAHAACFIAHSVKTEIELRLLNVMLLPFAPCNGEKVARTDG